ncbi:hypothetical protein WJX72_004795 [[Myrmecia] bisecta]|uniref:PspA/IM30 family protein n=1 Tax=[Myrmecia] bisecta TaxID=41462 RepID=A0AAW1QQE9_9CHLO
MQLALLNIVGLLERWFTISPGLLDRFARVMRSYFNFYGDSALRELEDPRKILDQAVSEMQQDLIKLRQASAQVFATQRMMEAKQRQAKTEADEWYKRAEFALRKGDEDLAREALKRHKAFAATASTMDAQLQQHTKAADTLRSNIRLMESKLSEAKTKKETLQARAASAQATVQLNQSINGLVSGLQTVGKDGLAAFNRMEEKVLAMEAEAEAAGQTFGNDALEARFGMLEGGGGVEDDLIKLKTDMLAGGRALSGERQGYAFSMVFERD